MEELAKLLKRIRKSRGIRQEELQKKLSSSGFITNLERGAKKISIQEIPLLCGLYKVKMVLKVTYIDINGTSQDVYIKLNNKRKAN